MQNKIYLDDIIRKKFPNSFFPWEEDDKMMSWIYMAYNLGFKEGYGMADPSVMIDMEVNKNLNFVRKSDATE